MTIRQRAIVALIPMVVAACAEAGTTGPGGGARLDGVTWVLSDASIAALVADAPPGGRVDLTFDDDQAGGRAACNIYGGDVQIDGDAITIGALSMTEMACEEPLMALEAAYMTALAEVRTYSIGEGTLTLSGGDMDDLTFEAEEPGEPLPLIGTEWSLVSIAQGDAVSSTIAGTEVTLTLGDDGTASGGASCNRFSGSYEVDGSGLTFGPLATTKMSCAEDGVMEQEQQVLAALEATRSFTIDGAQLTLSDGDGAMLLGFSGPAGDDSA